MATQSYQSGLVAFLAVLESERSLFTTQDALVQSDQAVSLNLVQLYRALGGGWESEPKALVTSDGIPKGNMQGH